MEKKNRDILDIIDEEIKEAYRCFDIGKKQRGSTIEVFTDGKTSKSSSGLEFIII